MLFPGAVMQVEQTTHPQTERCHRALHTPRESRSTGRGDLQLRDAIGGVARAGAGDDRRAAGAPVPGEHTADCGGAAVEVTLSQERTCA